MNNQQLLPVDYRDEFVRIQTFPQSWSAHYKKDELAKEGFFCISNSSWVCCFACTVNLNTEIADLVSIRGQHMTKSPSCPMVLNTECGNVPMTHKTIYKCERDRLYSFCCVDFRWPVDVHDLAKSGFYYDPSRKSSCCFFCKLQIGSWTLGDTGLTEHQKYNPTCSYFTQQPGVENVPLGLENTPQGAKIINAALAEESNPNQQLQPLAIGEPPKTAKYKDKKDRMSSFATWPASMKQRPGELADAGFFYSSTGDHVECYQCGGRLRDWGREDIPWEEHAFWFPYCELVKVVKGVDFISEMQHRKKIPTNKRSTIAPIDSDILDEDESIEIDGGPANDPPGDDALREVRLCKVCLTKELGIVFLPCAHMATCPDCAPQLTTCPICRSNFCAYVRAFLPA